LCDKVNIALAGQLFSDPFLENLGEALVDLEPAGVEAQAKWGSVCAVMSERENNIPRS